MLDNSIEDTLNSLDSYNNILDMSTSLCGFDVVNRILIEIQRDKGSNVNIKELKTEQEIKLLRRKLSKSAKVINVLIPIKSVKYVDAETGAEIDKSKLSLDDIKLALDNNIIKKIETASDFSVLGMYNIEDTLKSKKSEVYNADKALVSVDNALNMLQSITGATIKSGESTSYNIDDGVIEISKGHRDEMYTSISSFIAQFIINDRLADFIDDTDELKEIRHNSKCIKLLNYSIAYTVSTVLRSKLLAEIDESILKDIDTRQKMIIIRLCNYIGSVMLSMLDSMGNQRKSVDINDIKESQKAELMLNVMRANEIYRKFSDSKEFIID